MGKTYKTEGPKLADVVRLVIQRRANGSPVQLRLSAQVRHAAQKAQSVC